MAFFEKTEYWGLKDPLEVRVQHGTCIYMGDTFSRHFEPKKFNRVGRRGQKQPKWGIFGGTKIPPFMLKQIYRDIKFILRGLPERCGLWNKVDYEQDLDSCYFLCCASSQDVRMCCQIPKMLFYVAKLSKWKFAGNPHFSSQTMGIAIGRSRRVHRGIQEFEASCCWSL